MFFQKITKNAQRRELRLQTPHILLRPPSMIRLRHTILLITHPNLHFLGEIEPSLYSKILVMCQQLAHDLRSANLQCLCLQKIPLSKISDDVIACELWFGPCSNQKFWLRLCNVLQYAHFNHDQ